MFKGQIKERKFLYKNDSVPSDKKTVLSVIIVNYNLADEIEDCLNSFFEKINSAGEIDFEIIIIDNNSPDKRLHEIEKKFKKINIHFYYLNENIGFGKGCNYGFSKASGRYICFLNPDTLIQEDIFLSIIKLFENDKSIGVIGPRQMIKSPFFDFSAGFSPNVFFELLNVLGIGVFFEGLILFLYTKLTRNKKIEVHWILGAAIFIRYELFKVINGFDEDYFMFFEEVDLCKRVANMGLKIIYCPGLKIHHIGSVSGKKDYRLYTIRTYSSKYTYILKHYKSLKKLFMRVLFFAQVFSQIIIWTLLFVVNQKKSKQKLSAFLYLLKQKIELF